MVKYSETKFSEYVSKEGVNLDEERFIKRGWVIIYISSL